MIYRIITKKVSQTNRTILYRSLSNNLTNNNDIIGNVASEYFGACYLGIITYNIFGIITDNSCYSPENVASTNGAMLMSLLYAPILVPFTFPKSTIIFWLWRLDSHGAFNNTKKQS